MLELLAEGDSPLACQGQPAKHWLPLCLSALPSQEEGEQAEWQAQRQHRDT